MDPGGGSVGGAISGLGAISEVEWKRSLVRLEVGLVGGSGSAAVMVPAPETQMLEQELVWGKDPESSYGHVVGCWTSRWNVQVDIQVWNPGLGNGCATIG